MNGEVVICRLFTVASGLAQPISYVGKYGMYGMKSWGVDAGTERVR